MKKKGLVERIVMKEPSKEGFSQHRLPNDRKQLLSYMLKNKFSKIYKNHLLMALFFIPLVVWGILTMSYSDMLFSLDPREGIILLPEYWVTVYVTAIPLWMLAFVGISGGLNVLRKLAWSDPVILMHDFVHGIKASGKQMAFVGFLWASAYALIRYAIDWLGFYYRVFDDSASIVFGIFVCLFVMLVAVGMTVYMACMSSMYNVNAKELLVGAFKLYFADFLPATGVIILSLLPVVIFLSLDYAITTLIAYILTLATFIGILVIPMMLMCQHSFDRIINKKDYPDYYGKGLSYGTYSSPDIVDDVENSLEIDEKNKVTDDFERVTDDEN